MNCGSKAMIQSEGRVIPKEVTCFSKPEKGTAKLQQDQDHVNWVF